MYFCMQFTHPYYGGNKAPQQFYGNVNFKTNPGYTKKITTQCGAPSNTLQNDSGRYYRCLHYISEIQDTRLQKSTG